MRLLITGPAGAGKSTLIRSISDTDAVETDWHSPDRRGQTTVALDFGRLSIGPQQAIHLYGTPGQRRFDFMREILIGHTHACLLLISAAQPKELHNARQIYQLTQSQNRLPTVIGLTHADCQRAWHQKNIALALGLTVLPGSPPTVALDPRSPTSVFRALHLLAQQYLLTLAATSAWARELSIKAS